MNLITTLELYAGGPGSGCRGPNCGRHEVRTGKLGEESGKKLLSQLAKEPRAVFLLGPNSMIYAANEEMGYSHDALQGHLLELGQKWAGTGGPYGIATGAIRVGSGLDKGKTGAYMSVGGRLTPQVADRMTQLVKGFRVKEYEVEWDKPGSIETVYHKGSGEQIIKAIQKGLSTAPGNKPFVEWGNRDKD